MVKESITRSLAKFVSGMSYENLPDDITHRAKNLLLYALGSAVAGRDMPCSYIALELIKGNRGNSTIFTYDLKVPQSDAAFVNATLTNATSQEDCLFTSHPGTVIVPTTIAVAEQEGSSGAELISAMVAGYEVMGRVYLGAPSITPRFRGTPVFGVFGAAAAAGKLLGLNEDQLTNALGYAANFASGLNQCWIDGTMEGHLHAGVATRNGMIAANLAKAGAAASEKTLEGDWGFYQAFTGTTGDASSVTHDLGRRFLIMEASYKPYPVCGTQQIPIDIILKLINRYHVMAKDIKQIVEKVPYRELAIPGCDNAGPFKNAAQTLLSAQFCAAAAFLGKSVSSHRFYINSYDDPEILALAQKVMLIGEKDRNLPEITVVLDDGKTYSLEEGKEQGALIPTDEKMRAKFNELALDFLGEKRASEVIDVVMSLENVVRLQELTHLLMPL